MNMTRCHCLWGVDKFMVVSYEHDSVTLFVDPVGECNDLMNPHPIQDHSSTWGI